MSWSPDDAPVAANQLVSPGVLATSFFGLDRRKTPLERPRLMLYATKCAIANARWPQFRGIHSMHTRKLSGQRLAKRLGFTIITWVVCCKAQTDTRYQGTKEPWYVVRQRQQRLEGEAGWLLSRDHGKCQSMDRFRLFQVSHFQPARMHHDPYCCCSWRSTICKSPLAAASHDQPVQGPVS